MTDEEFTLKKNTMKEKWKQLYYENEYQNYDISNTGRIRNHETKKEYKLSKTPGMKNCYEFYNIKLNNGHMKNVGIHRLMGLMFIPIPKKYLKEGININNLVIDHIDNIKYHNIIGNLQWLTKAENVRKWYQSVASLKDLTISDKTVKKICNDLCKGFTIYEIYLKYGVSELLVYDIRYRRRYTKISEKFTFPSRQISNDDAVLICENLQKGMSAADISRTFGFPESTVIHILSRNSWTQVSKDYIFPNTRTGDDTVIKICELLQDRTSIEEISKLTGASKRTIEHIRARDTHTDVSKDYVFEYNRFKIPDETIYNICIDLASKKFINKEIAERNNVSLSFVKSIKQRKHRTDISDNYEW